MDQLSFKLNGLMDSGRKLTLLRTFFTESKKRATMFWCDDGMYFCCVTSKAWVKDRDDYEESISSPNESIALEWWNATTGEELETFWKEGEE